VCVHARVHGLDSSGSGQALAAGCEHADDLQ
jgi:hypothetical protein